MKSNRLQNTALNSVIDYTHRRSETDLQQDSEVLANAPSVVFDNVSNSAKKPRSKTGHRVDITLNEETLYRAKAVASAENLPLSKFCALAVARAVRDFERKNE